MTFDLATEAWALESTPLNNRIKEAAGLFHDAVNGSFYQKAKLQEAFSTSDFPKLLAAALGMQAVAAQKAAVPEFDSIVTPITVDDFRERKLVDLWSLDEFQPVNEGEEYKGGTLAETDLTHKARKHGLVYGLTWELIKSGDFARLANFPLALANASVRGQNKAVANLLVDDAADNWSSAFFGAVQSAALTPENLDLAIKKLAVTEDHRGDLVDVTNLVLVYGPALRTEVNRILKASELEMDVTNGNKVTKTKVQNPFMNVVQPLESRSVAKLLGANAGTGWALVQGTGSTLPGVIKTLVSGEETVDIRVKTDQGSRIGGGQLGYQEGSFKDDTIWFRGRDVYGIDKGFTEGVLASSGTDANGKIS